MKQYIYLAPNVERTALKIGYSDSPDTRLWSIDGDINYDKTIAFECNTVRSTEKFLHTYFEDFSIEIYKGNGKTEWFEISILPIVIETIRKYKKMLSIEEQHDYCDVFEIKTPSKFGRPKGHRKLAGILTPEEFNSLIGKTFMENHGLRNATILYLSHYTNIKANNLAKLNMGDLEAKVDKVNNKELQQILYRYIDFRKTKDGLVYNILAPAFVSQKGLRFTPNSLVRMILNVYINLGFVDCSYTSGKRSELYIACDRILFT